MTPFSPQPLCCLGLVEAAAIRWAARYWWGVSCQPWPLPSLLNTNDVGKRDFYRIRHERDKGIWLAVQTESQGLVFLI